MGTAPIDCPIHHLPIKLTSQTRPTPLSSPQRLEKAHKGLEDQAPAHTEPGTLSPLLLHQPLDTEDRPVFPALRAFTHAAVFTQDSPPQTGFCFVFRQGLNPDVFYY